MRDAVAVAGFLVAAAIMFATAWLMLDLRNSWFFGWLPF